LAKKQQNADTQAFKIAFEQLKKEGKIVSQAELATSLGIDKSSLSLVFAGSRDIPYKYYRKFLDLYGEVGKSLQEANENESNGRKVTHVPINHSGKGVPVYDVDFAAGDKLVFNETQQNIVGYIDFEGFRRCVGFVKVKGNSMFPDFTAGDIIGLEPLLNFEIIEYGQPHAIVMSSGQRLFKIIRKGVDDDNLILRSANSRYDDINIHKSKIASLFMVHGPVRDSWH
jgi:phage repressor protein C with HTH and peptisase S24 domain